MEKEEEAKLEVFAIVQGTNEYLIDGINKLHLKGYFPFGNITSVVIQDQVIHTQLMKR